MSTNLTRYNQSQYDRNTAAHDESLLGHYVQEQGWAVKEALENLAPNAKQAYAQTVSVASTAKWLSVAGGVIGLIAGGTLGLVGVLPIGAAALAFFTFREANNCIPRREIELRALKNCPNLLELMYGCHLKGVDNQNLIAAWDIFLDNYESSGSADANLMAREYLRILTGLLQAPVDPDNPDNWAKMPKELPEHQPAKITTQLGETSAIDVPAQPATSWQESSVQATIDYIQQMRSVVNRNNSFYIGGSKGSGKGMFAANLLRWKLDQYPNAIAFVLDPKDDAKEAGYWEHPRIKRFAFRGIALNKAAYAAKVAEFLSQARNLVSQADVARGMRLFLVFDELLTLKTKLDKPIFDELASFGAEAISTGDSAGIHVIAITQSFNAGDSFGSDEVLKNFTQVGLFREDEYMRAKKQVNQNRTNASLEQSEFNQLAKQSPVKRVMQIAGNFVPTPKLENYSAYDRDSEQMIKELPLGSNPSEGDLLADQLKAEVAKATASAQVASPQSDDRIDAVIAAIKLPDNQDSEGWVKLRDIQRTLDRDYPGISSDEIEGYCRTLAYVHKQKFEFQVKQGRGVPSKQIRAID
ncbi:unknown protein [Leptolyngbya sp. NIES-3755]|nr:unknown protein [Leptolyngbya sp. NIES-3755]